MGNVIKVVGGLAAIIFVLLAFGPGGFMAGGGGGSGIGTIGIAEEYKQRQGAKGGGSEGGPRGVADERFVDAPVDGQAGSGQRGANGGPGGDEEYDFFETLARVLGLSG
ncbi:MAG: hypothetical protein AAF968_04935 [Pseudomonadota bacterium]